jgi:hypothetical protein
MLDREFTTAIFLLQPIEPVGRKIGKRFEDERSQHAFAYEIAELKNGSWIFGRGEGLKLHSISKKSDVRLFCRLHSQDVLPDGE